MTNKEFCKKLGIKPKYCAREDGIYSFPFEDLNRYLLSKDESLLEGNEYFLEEEFYPDFLSDTPNAAYNREKLEECILKVFDDIFYFFNSDGLFECKADIREVGWDTDDYFNYRVTAENKPLALLSLAIQIADEIKEEVQKQEFIY
jgi:hypothetical protein